jgi:RNA-binding protein YhbY
MRTINFVSITAAAAAMSVVPAHSFVLPAATFTRRHYNNKRFITETSLSMLWHISSTISGYQPLEASAEFSSATVSLHDSNDSTDLSRPADDDSLLQDEEEQEPLVILPNMEKAWRYAKKPLLSIGAKGATPSHGNSLRQLLEAHQVVKIKVNTKQFSNSLNIAFETLSALAKQAGMADELELLHVRTSENIILVGAKGMREKIESNEFPPPPKEDEEEWSKERRKEELKAGALSS